MIANKSNKAIVLIATIATLAVISVILMFFAQSSIFERQLTSNNNLERQAKLVATASIEWAASYIPKLAMGVDDGDSSVSNKAYSSVADFYQFKVINSNESGKYDPHCPVEEHYLAPDSSKEIERGGYVGIPSFHYKEKEVGLPYEYSYRQNFDTNMVSLPTLHNPSDKLKDNTVSKGKPRWTVHSTLKCVDANAFWNINSPITTIEKDDSGKEYNNIENYRTMVNNLLSIVSLPSSSTNTWVNERKKKNFSDLGDFRERMKNALNQQQLDKICRYITVDSWGNEKSFLYGKYKDTDDKKDYNHIDKEPTPEDPKKIFEKRYPININVASWEILATVFANIKTTHNQNPPIEIKIDIEEAIPLAKSIVKDRTKNSLDKESNNPPFKTWNEVEDYLYNYFKDKDQGKDKAEAIFAVIYPGMLPNKKSPNRAQYRKFDKMDVEIGTTECCLFSPGVFYCEAIGRVIEYGKKPYTVLAHSKVSVNMKLWEPYIVNSQADFESQRTTKEDSDAWTGIEGGITPKQKYNQKKDNVIVGYLQEIQEERKAHRQCRYWQWSNNYNLSSSKDEDNKKEMRSDGLYFNKEGYLEDNYGILDLNSSNYWDEWDNKGFDLWIKPSYNPGDDQDAKVTLDNNNTLPIAMKVEKSTVDSCYILTRCAYDKGVDYDNNMTPHKEQTYLTLSRTLCLKTKDQSGKDCSERDTTKYRVFYNDTIRENVKKLQSEALRLVGSNVYGALVGHVDTKAYGFRNNNEIMLGDHQSPFSENFTHKIYNTVLEGKEEFFEIDFKINSIDIGNGYHYKTHNGILKVYLPKNSTDQQDETTKWCKVEIMSHDFLPGGNPREFIVEAKENSSSNEKKTLYFYKYFFSYNLNCYREDGKTIGLNATNKNPNWIDPQNGIKNQLYYGYIERNSNETKEAQEIVWFPGKGEETENTPIQTNYKYSRTECRIPITLYKGRWYHIHARWEDNKILIKEFDVSYKKMKSEMQENGNNHIPNDHDRTKIHTEKGFIRKNFIGGPGRLWVNKNGSNENYHDIFDYPAENEINKIYYYCPNCVIYYSNYRKPSDNNKKRWRYGSPEKTESIYNGKFNLENMHAEHNDPNYFYYGTVAWTQFAPENKRNNNTDDKELNGAMFGVTINGDEKQFYSWGEEKKSSKDLENPNSIFMKEYTTNKNMPFKFDLHDNNNEGEDSASHLETTIVDRVVLYMIVQPQPIHWSYNTYKDKNLYH